MKHGFRVFSVPTTSNIRKESRNPLSTRKSDIKSDAHNSVILGKKSIK